MLNITTPDWIKDAIFYQIFPDRFARSSYACKAANIQNWTDPPSFYRFQGGDLSGIVDKLDYLYDLGINAIYLNPIFQSTTNHRYRTHDYYRIDPFLGNDETFHKLLNAAHTRGIRIVLDGAFNHVSRGFYQFNHILEYEDGSPYLDWFHIKGFPLYAYDESRPSNYEAWFGNRKYPKLNTNNPEVRNFLFGVIKYWTNKGIDGWRLDAFSEINDESFWREFRKIVKSINSEAYIFGEIWVDEIHNTAARWLRGDQLDAIMNYGFASACIGLFIGDYLDGELIKGQGHVPDKTIGAEEFADRVDIMLNNYDRQIVYAQYNMLESHDTVRYITLARHDKRILKLATTFQMTYVGVPGIYYGTEIGLAGGRDPDCRRAMPWEQSMWDTELLEYFKKIISIRKSYPSLRRGDYIRLYANSLLGVYAYMRRLKEEKIIVILNNKDNIYPVNIPISDHLPDKTKLDCLMNNSSYIVKAKLLQGPPLPPRGSAILIVRNFS